MADEWITQEEAADRLHIALDTMRRWVREGRFRRAKVGKRYLIPVQAIEEFLESQTQTGPRPVTPRKPNSSPAVPYSHKVLADKPKGKRKKS